MGLETGDSPVGVVTIDTDNLVQDDGSVNPDVIQSFGGVSAEALSVLHGVITNELNNRGVYIRGAA